MTGTGRRELVIPRLVIGGVASGVGKTTAVVALVKAFEARGLRVAPFKCGPDYLDPTYHARAAGRPSPNVDGWMMGRDGVLATFARAAQGADLAIIEGVMGLYDGASPTDDAGSTAEIAKWLASPVVAVVDASGMARTIAAVGQGLAAFDPEVRLAGLLCNRVGSRGHLDILRKACRNPPVLGGFPKADEALRFSSRHLGLQTARGDVVGDATLDAWGALATEWISLDALLGLARSAPPLDLDGSLTLDAVASDRPPRAARCTIAVAFDDALHFYYDDNLARLEAHGARLVRFSPIRDAALPAVDGLYLGGGYPEVHADALAKNTSMRGALRAFADAGGPVYAECGGLMLLTDGIHTREGFFPMAGVLPGEVTMHDELRALGYVEVETQRDSILGPAGTRFRGHQFRYSHFEPASTLDARLYSVRRRRVGDVAREGFVHKQVVASYVHAHWASNPRVAEAFVDACAAHAAHGGSR